MTDPLPLWPSHVRCDGCAHWRGNVTDDGPLRWPWTFQRPGAFKRCMVPRERWNDDAVPVLASGGDMLTRADFGCRLWKPRP